MLRQSGAFKMSRILSLSLILVITAALAYAEDEDKKEIDKGLYTIVAPGTIRPNSKYTISVNLHKSDEPCEFKVGVIGPSLSELKTVKIQPFSSEEVKFEFGKLESGDYNLTAEGVCGTEFKNSTKLNFESQKYIILLQTDKATYKPDDLVRFRVLILDKNTKPAKLEGPVLIVIDDPAQNRIKQIDNAEFTKGLYSGELQLSPFPLLGKWSISVTADGESSQKEFDVDKYVLPKFEISVDVPKYVAAKDGKVNAIVRAKYTYGKSVKGDALVTIKPKWGFYGMEKANVKTKTLPVDGKGSVSFDIENDLKFGESWENTYVITAVVTEKLTGVKLNASADVTVHRQRYRIETVKIPPFFNFDVPFDVTVVVKNYDESPVQDSSNPVVITLSESGGGYYRPYPIPILRTTVKPDVEEEVEGKFQPLKEGKTLDENGMATVTFTIPKTEKDEKKHFQLNAKYLDVESFLGTVSKEEKKNVDDTFKIEVQPEKPTLEDEITVTVSTSKGLDYFFYQVIGRGNILKSDYVKVPEGATSHEFKIKPTFCMVPTVSIYVYYIKDGEIVHDEKRVDLEEKLPNIMKITAPLQTQPGKDVDIKVTTKPNSLVGLMGVDQSVLLLKSGNDLSADDVFSKIRDFKTDTPWEATPYYHPRYPGRDSGVITFTNAKLPEFQRLPPVPYPIALSEVERVDVAFASVRPESTIQVRKEFPESWIWSTLENNESGEITIHQKIPDTITSWVLTGFSISPDVGLGITKQPRKIEVFQPFFVSTSVPYSIKRGEVVAIPAIVFNYQDTDAEVTITFDNSEKEFEFVDPSNEIDETGADDAVRTIRAIVEKNSGVSKSFLVRPKKVGHLSLNLKAVTATAGDAIKQVLPCEPEGVTQYLNKAYLINLKDANEQNEEISIDIKDPVSDSTYCELTVVGDLLGPTIKNLDKLIRMPYGCGEQNMVNFVPIIFVLQYLENANKLTPAIKTKALKYLELGYQRELNYKHPDGSYSAFGASDKSGSTWLTAYVAKSFRQADKYITIDENIIGKALEFLVKTQAENGSFPEVGHVLDHSFSSKTEKSLTLTAFVLLALIENQSKFPMHGDSIKKGLNFLAKNIDDKTDIYDLALSTYALQLGKHEAKDTAIEKLKAASTLDGQRQYWKEEKEEKKSDIYWWTPANADVEITSYALLALLDSGAGEETLPIIKYLISKRNSQGGFDSTQDTVIGLQALIKFASKYSGGAGSVDIDFKDDLGNSGKITANEENSLVLQTHILQPTPSSVSISAKGTGSALVQVSCRYNVVKADESPKFTLKPTVKESSSPEFLVLSVCTSFNGDGEQKTSNMAVMEVSLPSGYVADPDNLAELEKFDRVKRVETKNGDTVVILYFDDLDGTELCPEIKGFRAHRVAKQKPAPVEVYDYYKTSRRAKAFYEIPATPLKDLCDEDCASGREP